MATRKFNFPLSVRLGSSRRLYDALSDADYAATMGERLNADTDTPTDNFTIRFEAKITAFSTGQANQNAQTGQAGTLTRDQTADFQEMERLIAGARRSARLAFPDDPVKYHSAFQVGINEPNTLDAELDRAGIIVASCQKAENVAPLKAQGWTAADSTALAAAVSQLSGTSLAKGDAVDDRIGLTSQKITAANAVYADALRIQNAARLQYPANKPGNETARARFLLDEFPPRDRSDPSGGTQAATVGTTPAAATKPAS